ncbi:MAG: HypC/HybG/HupF family hydrogenase formation chaperone [Synergistaceae bacterium]|jgi:hydrogenase expression/formation protein HypC|nr:HypC/HybG/HupF family hydrogenase formation chaperone [Synergistaceae bacterium]
MCLAVPYTLEEIHADGSARAVANGVAMNVRLDLVEAPVRGDVVLVHAGFAIQKLDKRESEELIALWAEVERAEKTAGMFMSHA